MQDSRTQTVSIVAVANDPNLNRCGFGNWQFKQLHADSTYTEKHAVNWQYSATALQADLL